METVKSNTPTLTLYKTIWRWHFYAGILFAPLLVMLAVTGAVYLFKPQIENTIYQEYYEVQPQGEKLAPSEQVANVLEKYPQAIIMSYRPGEHEQRSSELHLSNNGESFTVYINPYTGAVIGELADDDRIMDKIEKIHGEIMLGTTGDRIVELAACWAIILIVTGLYLWFPTKTISLAGVLVPRFHKGKQVLARDIHVVPAFWITAGMLFLILTGLPWSGLWGTTFQSFATNAGVGYPPSIWTGSAPTSTIQTEDVAEVPWAAETLDVPQSQLQGFTPLSIDDVAAIAERVGVDPSYSIYIPSNPSGVYTLSAFPAKAENEMTIHVDQYTGAILADYRFEHYGTLGKIVALGITLHKGTQFGLVNQLISLLICLGIILVVVSGIYLWLKRKPQNRLGAPSAPSIIKMRGFLLLMIILGIFFPLVGLSLIIVWALDFLLIKRIPRLKKFFNA